MLDSKMKPEVKEKWIDTLLSGKYEQGREELQTADGKFCCLGVLCEMAIADGVVVDVEKAGTVTYNGEYQFLPYEVQQWAGMKSNDGEFSEYNELENYAESFSLAVMNDAGKTFPELVDKIRVNF